MKQMLTVFDPDIDVFLTIVFDLSPTVLHVKADCPVTEHNINFVCLKVPYSDNNSQCFQFGGK